LLKLEGRIIFTVVDFFRAAKKVLGENFGQNFGSKFDPSVLKPNCHSILNFVNKGMDGSQQAL
jgi:hypothetical protein